MPYQGPPAWSAPSSSTGQLVSTVGAPGSMGGGSGSTGLAMSSAHSATWPTSLSSHFAASQSQQHGGLSQALGGVLKARGRSSSMLSQVSGFTQSSAADDDQASGGPGGSTTALQGTLRGAPAAFLPFSRTRQRSDGGSGSGPSSVRSGSGSGGSTRDPTSPIA
jgi:hypothetical protein